MFWPVHGLLAGTTYIYEPRAGLRNRPESHSVLIRLAKKRAHWYLETQDSDD